MTANRCAQTLTAIAAASTITGGGDGPAFSAAWEAQAFALTVALHAQGHFTWPEWTSALSLAISRAQEAGDADTGETYYQHWLVALETLAAEKRLTDAGTLSLRRSAWHRAAARTPHGSPIELESQDFDD
jgi:nitrile hydratase accessory protein